MQSSNLTSQPIPSDDSVDFLGSKYKKIKTSSSGDLCGLAGIAHYVARRDFHERVEIYKNILRHKHQFNSANILQINDLSDSWFIFLEDFLTKRNEKAKGIIDDISSNLDDYLVQSDFAEFSAIPAIADSDFNEEENRQLHENTIKQKKILRALKNSSNQASGHLYQMDKILFFELIKKYPELKSQPDDTKFIELFAITSQQKMLEIAGISRSDDEGFIIDSFKEANENNQYFWMVYLFLDYHGELQRIIGDLEIQDQRNSVVAQARNQFNFGEAELKNLFKMAIRGLSFEELQSDKELNEKKLLIKSDAVARITSISPQQDCLLENNRDESHYSFMEPENSITPFSTIGYYASSMPSTDDHNSVDLTSFHLASNHKIVRTSNDNYLSGYCAIANYIKFLSPSQRLEAYRKILSKAWQKKTHGSTDSPPENPFETVDKDKKKELDLELRFVEEFLKRREMSKENKDIRKEFDFTADKKDFDEIKNYQSGIDREYAHHINSLNYEDIIKKYFLNGEVQTTDGRFQVIFGDDIPQDQNRMIKRFNIKDSYQIWIAGMIACYRDQGNKISVEELKESFKELFPESSINCYHPEISAVPAQAHSLAPAQPPNQPIPAFEPNDENLLYLENFQLRAIEELSLEKFTSSSNPDELIFYKSLNLIVKELKKDPHGYRHFLNNDEYDKFWNDDDITSCQIGLESYCQQNSITQPNLNNIFNKALQYFKTEFSFERQNFHAQYFNRLQVYHKSDHFSTLVSKDRFDTPFPREESIESTYFASIDKEKIKSDIRKTTQDLIDSINSQPIEGPQDQGSDENDSPQTPSPSPQIFYRTTSLFQKLSGRKDDNFRYALKDLASSNSLGAKFKNDIIDVIKFSALVNESVESENDQNTNENIVLAMLIAKNFGGIGTKIAEIEGKIADQSSKDKYLKELLKISYPAEIDRTGKTPEELASLELKKTMLLDKFEKLKDFSAQFQKQCKNYGIYSGNENIDKTVFSNQKSIKTRHGLRLAFIPDEIVVEYINKLPKDNHIRKLAMNIIKENKSKNIRSSNAR